LGNVDVVVGFSIIKARNAHARMAQKIIAEDKLPREIKLIFGVDVAYSENIAFGAAGVLDYVSFEVLEVQTVTQKVKFPYVPTLFSFENFQLE
jgi:deoxyinosine 3'endonuclease (endonuclease V)